MNIHHLELFYYVAKHEGISEAVRNMPYGIQQPAVSGQILQLEDTLGTTLFQRRPFQLTAAGKQLFQFIEPFFSRISQVQDAIRDQGAHNLRIGASQIVLRDHLPSLLSELKKQYPQIRLTLREGSHVVLESWLQKQELDVLLTLIERKPAQGISGKTLFKLPLALIMDKSHKWKTAQELWAQGKIEDPLLCLPSHEVVCKLFQQNLSRIGVEWFPSIELPSLELIKTYVAEGYGIGLVLDVPKMEYPKNVRKIVLNEFDLVEFGILWQQQQVSAVMGALIAECEKRAVTLFQ